MHLQKWRFSLVVGRVKYFMIAIRGYQILFVFSKGLLLMYRQCAFRCHDISFIRLTLLRLSIVIIMQRLMEY